MTRLTAKKMDTAEAAADIALMLQEELPNARNVRTTIEGEGTSRTFGQAYRAEIKSILAGRTEPVFTVVADADTPRPVRIRCEYIAIGPHALVGSTLFLTRLRRVVPGTADYTQGRLAWSSLKADPGLRERLEAAPGLGKTIGKFLREVVLIGASTVTYEPHLRLVPADGGTIVAAFTVPKMGRFGGFSPRSLDVASFLAIVDALDAAVAMMPGTSPAAVPPAELP